ncbi:MAG TPA: hypothetical protein VLN26_05105, partial [Gaiellaceae bacterium]|nr:hypothetical protein [Gaiellaceae bacterium]
LPGAVRCLTASDSTVWAGGDGVSRSDDGGRTWAPAGLDDHPVRALAVDGERLYAGVKPAAVWVDDGTGWRPLAPFPRLRSWWWWSPAERPHDAYVLGLAVEGDVVLAGIEAGALLRSDDGGRSWSGHCRGASRDCHQLGFAADVAYEVGGAKGLALSRDAGRTWRSTGEGLRGRYGWSAAVRGEDVFLTTARMLTAHGSDAQACIYRGDGERPWTRVLGPLSALPRLAAGDEGVYAAWSGALHTTSDGAAWSPLRDDLPGPARALLVL